MASSVTTSKTRAATQSASSVTSSYSVPVVRSTFSILEALSRAEYLGLREVTQVTRIPKSTVFRILSTLVDLGYVLRDANRNYRISPSLSTQPQPRSNCCAARDCCPAIVQFHG